MSNWYVAQDGKSLGPFSSAQLSFGLESGQYTPATMVWRDGFSDWLRISQVEELTNPPAAAAGMAPPATGCV